MYTENKKNKMLPAIKYLQATAVVLLLLYFGKSLFVPLFFGLLIALLSYPICRALERKGAPRGFAIAVIIFSLVLVFGTLLWLLLYELNLFVADIPKVSQKLTQLAPDFSGWVETKLGLNREVQDAWSQRMIDNFANSVSGFLKSALNTTVSTIFILVMTPIYAALFLYHRGTFVRFLESVIDEKYKTTLPAILKESSLSYYRYVKGTFFVYCIIGVLNSIGLMALGIDHAILYGMVTSFMMVVPYIGIFISAALPVSVALITKNSIWYPIGVVAVFVVIQYLESNVIFPRIVGEQLNLGTWATLVAIMIGTLLWGIAGMVLFTPFAAILKIISDHVEELAPLNLLLNRKSGYGGT